MLRNMKNTFCCLRKPIVMYNYINVCSAEFKNTEVISQDFDHIFELG